jgi:hypothetical protein
MCWAYFMAYGVIESTFMSAIVECTLALELSLSKHYVFPNPLICLFIVYLPYLQVPFIRFQAIASLFGTGANVERVELKYGLAFESPLLFSLSFFIIILLLFFFC